MHIQGHCRGSSRLVIDADYREGLESEAKRNGWTVEVSTHDRCSAEEILRTLESASVAGAVVLGTELSEQDVAAFESVRMPLVFIDTYHASVKFDFVDMNNDSSVFSVVSYLKDLGHHDVGLVKGAIETRNFRLREKSFAEALEHYKLGFDEANVFAIDSAYEKGVRSAGQRLRESGAASGSLPQCALRMPLPPSQRRAREPRRQCRLDQRSTPS